MATFNVRSGRRQSIAHQELRPSAKVAGSWNSAGLALFWQRGANCEIVLSNSSERNFTENTTGVRHSRFLRSFYLRQGRQAS
jgi:hypothetical protein